MSPVNEPEPEPQPAGMGAFSRLTGVFFEPTKTFEDIAQRPSWIVPLVVVILSALAVSFAISSHLGWDRVMRHQLEMSPRTAQMTAEQREQAIQLQVKIASVSTYAGPIIGVPLYYLIIAGILLGITAIMSAGLKFKQVYAIVCYSGLPGLISAALLIAVMFLKNPDEFNLSNPLAFNPGAFMDPMSGSKFVYSVASSLDLFTIWTILLIATGIKAAAGKKVSFGGALCAVALPWAVWVLGKAAVAGVFS